MGSLKLTTASSGSVILSPANTASDTTISVPAITATMAINGPAFSAYRNGGSQNISSSTWTKVQLDAEDFDTNSNFDSTTNYRFTPTVAGYYLISGAIYNNGASYAATQGSAIYKNGSLYRQSYQSQSSASMVYSAVVTSVIYFNGTTDYVELYGYNTQSGAYFTNGSQWTYFSGSMVRAA